jgi:hypothetical protein
MKSILALCALCLLLTACSKAASDASVYRRVTGVWTCEARPGKVIENRSDGTVVVRVNGVETAKGEWQIKGGYLIADVGGGVVESNKVLSVSGDTMVVLSMDGHTQLTCHKQ